MKKRSNLAIMGRLIKEVKPLSGYMTMAILLGTLGNVTASIITVFGGFAILDVLGLQQKKLIKVDIKGQVTALFDVDKVSSMFYN